jgi:chromosome segregation ATPase
LRAPCIYLNGPLTDSPPPHRNPPQVIKANDASSLASEIAALQQQLAAAADQAADLAADAARARAERDAELAQGRKLLGDAARLQEQLSSATEDIFTLQKQLNGAIKRIDVLQDEKNAAVEARNEAAARADGLQVGRWPACVAVCETCGYTHC